MQNNYEIMPLENDDVSAVCEIESSLIGQTSEEKIRNTIESSTLFYYVLKLDNKVIGFYECSIISPEAELFDIAISKDFQGQGYSNLLMQNLIDVCKKCGCNTIFLEVNSINHKAIKLYEKFGFNKYSLRKNYYGDNDAILMKCEI
ncbi:MAG: ribosomal protein S18-alanine N-acetyltransferase [Clostridia bacterium]|nr:ribosomal protein S18-alanine N-acetyltransferase [Clostridia bacterium]